MLINEQRERPAIVEKQIKKILPYTVSDIVINPTHPEDHVQGIYGREAIIQWREQRSNIESALEISTQRKVVARAVAAFNNPDNANHPIRGLKVGSGLSFDAPKNSLYARFKRGVLEFINQAFSH